MKKVILKKLEIENFKSIRNISIDFEKETTISGPNGCGKSTIFDAFTWLLFDKNSHYETKFNIKPLDEFNRTKRVDTTISGVFEIDDKELILKKTYKEKWTKRRGDSEETFTGNETIYEVDDVPVKKNEYKKTIEESFCNEELFKLLTNPLFFSIQMPWKEQRQLILNIVGDISDESVIDSDSELEPLRTQIEKGIDKLLASFKATSKKLSEQKKEIPSRIDELNNSIVDVNTSEIEKTIEEKENELTNLEKVINGLVSNKDVIIKIKEEIANYKSFKIDIVEKAKERTFGEKYKLSDLLNEVNSKLHSKRTEYNNLDNTHKSKLSEIEALKEQQTQARKEYVEINNSSADLNNIDSCCPTCKRAYDEDYLNNHKQEIIENFNTNKANSLSKLATKGKELGIKIEEISKRADKDNEQKIELFKEINQLSKQVEELNTKIKEFNNEIAFLEEDELAISHYNNLISEAELKISELENSDNAATEKKEYEEQKKQIKNEISELQQKLGMQKNNANIVKRILDLEDEEKQLSAKIADTEKSIMLCEKFIIKKVELLESNINKYFKGVNFKLFEQQVNDGITETCEVLVNGVPFSDVNTAGKLNSGLSIINTISDFYKIEMPIFIDNRESIIDIGETNAQIVNLKVIDSDGLKIEGGYFYE